MALVQFFSSCGALEDSFSFRATRSHDIREYNQRVNAWGWEAMCHTGKASKKHRSFAVLWVHVRFQISHLLRWNCVKQNGCGFFFLGVFFGAFLFSLCIVERALGRRVKKQITKKEQHKSTSLKWNAKKALFPSKTFHRATFYAASLSKLLLWQKCPPILRELMERSPYASLSWLTVALQRIQHMGGNK